MQRAPKNAAEARERRAQVRDANAQLTGVAATDAVREAALRLLDTQARSRGDLAKRLAGRGYPSVVIARVLDRFEEVGLLDDYAYGAMLVRTRHQERGLVGPALVRELQAKGINGSAAEQALAQVTRESTAAVAEEQAARYLRSSVGKDFEVRLRRAVAALQRKGHSPGLAYQVVRDLIAEESEGNAE